MWQRSANAEHAFGMANLAWSYYNGVGTAIDLAAAADWYRRAGEAGHLESLYNLGLMYADGIGVPQDKEAAIEILNSVADAGLPDAKQALAKLSANH